MLHVATKCLVALVVLVLTGPLLYADDVTLAWDAAPGPAPASYRVRYGQWPGPPTQERQAGLATTLTVTGLTFGTTYEFHVVAVDAKGQISGPSNFVRVTVGGAAPPAGPPPPNTDGTGGSDLGSPPGAVQLYFAEGAQSTTFSTRLSLANPKSTPTTAVVTLKPDGSQPARHATVHLPPLSNTDIEAASILGSASGAFGIRVAAEDAVGVSRLMTWNRAIGGHSEMATQTPSRRWFFAEGATHGPFELFYLIYNPGPSTATVSVTYLLPTGPAAPRQITVPAGERRTLWVDQDGPDVAATDVAAIIESVTSQPIVAERAMYLTNPSGAFVGGHVTLGATAPRTHWLMAEGATGPYFSMFLLLANPNAKAAPVQVKFRRPDGVLVQRKVTVPARSRVTLDVAAIDERISNTAVWTEVSAGKSLPIVAERVMWWPGANWQDGHAALAATGTAARWLAVGGQQGGPQRHATYVLVANTASAAQTARVTVLGPTGPIGSTQIVVPGSSRHNIDMGATFPAVTGAFSVLVEAVGGGGRLVVEQSVYWDLGSRRWSGGTAGPAKPLDP